MLQALEDSFESLDRSSLRLVGAEESPDEATI